MDLVKFAQVYFPKLQIKYKDNSLFMKILGKLMFFNSSFMKTFTNTIGNTIYFPSQQYTIDNPVESNIILLHELVHMYDLKKKGNLFYSLLYMFPQCLVLLFLPLLFLSWKIALIGSLISLAPIPAYFRMQDEKRGYLCSMYTAHVYGKKYNFTDERLQKMLDSNKEQYVNEFYNSSYYFMWPFKSIKSDFDKAANRIKAGLKPFDDDVFKMIDDLLDKS